MSSNSPLISVVIPCYNIALRRKTLREAVSSVLWQDYPHIEIVVVDDGSSDDSRAVIQEIKAEIIESEVHAEGRSFRACFLNENGGTSIARNAGIEQATGELIAFLDFDDLYLPTFLSRAAQRIAENEETRVVLAPAYFSRRYGSAHRVYQEPIPADMNSWSFERFAAWVMRDNFPVPMGSSVVCHRKVFEDFSDVRFDPFLSKRTAEDVLFGYMLLHHKIRPWMLDAPCVVHRADFQYVSRGYGAFLNCDELEVFDYIYTSALSPLLEQLEEAGYPELNLLREALERKREHFSLKQRFLKGELLTSFVDSLGSPRALGRWGRQAIHFLSRYFPFSTVRTIAALWRCPDNPLDKKEVLSYLRDLSTGSPLLQRETGGNQIS